MMNQLKMYGIMLSYQMNARNKKINKSGRRQSGIMQSGLLLNLIIPLIFIPILFPGFYYLFSSTHVPVDTYLSLYYNDFIFSVFVTLFSLLFMFSFVPNALFTLYSNPYTQYFLTFPVKKSTYFCVEITELIYANLMQIIIIALVFAVQGMVNHLNIFPIILGFLSYLVFLVGLSFLLTLLLSSAPLSVSGLRKIITASSFVMLIFYVVFSNLVRPDQPGLFNSLLIRFEGMKDFITVFSLSWLPQNILYFLTYGQIYPLLFFYFLTLFLIYIFFNQAKKINFQLNLSDTKKFKKLKDQGDIIYRVYENSREQISLLKKGDGAGNPSKKGKTGIRKTGTVVPASRMLGILLKKDLILLKREPRYMFLIIYPLILPIIFFISNQSFGFVTSIFLVIGLMYTMTFSAQLIREERKIWPQPLIFPYTLFSAIKVKVGISVVIFFLEYILFLIISNLFGFSDLISLINTIPVLLILIYSGLYGARVYVSDKNRSIEEKNLFNFRESLVMQIKSISLGLLSFWSLHFFLTTSNTQFKLLSLALFILLMIIIPLLIAGEIKKLKIFDPY